jgi:hypothetical protein
VSAIFDGPTFALRVESSGSGRVVSQPAGIDCGDDCAERFDEGATVTLTATPEGDEAFLGWSGDCAGETAECTLTMSEDRAASAEFGAAMHAVDVERVGRGTVVSVPLGISCGEACAHDFEHGTALTLIAVPGSHAVFAGWDGDCAGAAAACELAVDGAKTVTASFDDVLAVTVRGEGTVTSEPAGIDCGASCEKGFAPGTEVTLTAVAAPHHYFGGFSGACAGRGECEAGSDGSEACRCTVAMDGARAVTASFFGGGFKWATNVPRGMFATLDPAGDVYAGGCAYEEMDVGCGAIEPGEDQYACFVAKLDGGDGHCLWSKKFKDLPQNPGGAYVSWIWGMGAGAGSVAFGGILRGTADFGCGNLTASELSFYAARLDAATGACTWSKAYGVGTASIAGRAPGVNELSDVQVDKNGDALLIGRYWGTVDVGCGAMTSSTSNTYTPDTAFVAKLRAADGSCAWSKRLQYQNPSGNYGYGNGALYGLALDTDGNIGIGKDIYAGAMDLGCAAFGETPSGRWFARWDGADGHCLSANRWQGYSAQFAILAGGDEVVAGDFEYEVDLGDGCLLQTDPDPTGNNVATFVQRRTGAGACVWARKLQPELEGVDIYPGTELRALAVDGPGDVLVAQTYSGRLDAGCGPFVSEYGYLISKLAGADASCKWSRSYGQEIDLRRLHGDAAGGALVWGWFWGEFDFGGGPVQAVEQDLFALKLWP